MYYIISTTNRNDARSLIVAKKYKEILESKQIPVGLMNLADYPAEIIYSSMYNSNEKNKKFTAIIDEIHKAEKFIFIVPEYNGSFPGIFKSFIDSMEYPNPFKLKKCALVGLASGGNGSSLALSHLTDIFNYLGMHVLAGKIRFSPINNFISEDALTEPNALRLLNKQADELIYF